MERRWIWADHSAEWQVKITLPAYWLSSKNSLLSANILQTEQGESRAQLPLAPGRTRSINSSVSSSTNKGWFVFISPTFLWPLSTLQRCRYGIRRALSDILIRLSPGHPLGLVPKPFLPPSLTLQGCSPTELLGWSFLPSYFVCKAAEFTLSSISSGLLGELKKLELNPGFPVSPWWAPMGQLWAAGGRVGTEWHSGNCTGALRELFWELCSDTAPGSYQGFNNPQPPEQDTL